MLDKQLPVPLYHQLKLVLLESIENGTWKPDDRLPTETELASTYAVSKITVRQALRELSDAGRVRREQGRGTFVARPRLELGPRELTSFTGEMRRHGWSAGSHVLTAETIEASGVAADELEVPVGSPVFLLKRLRLAGREPMGIQTAYIPLRLTPGITNLPLEGVSLYDTLQRHYGLYAVRARETHSAVLLDAEDADLLETAAGSPALAAERTSFLEDGRPLEYTTSIMRGDRYRIVLDLSGTNSPHH